MSPAKASSATYTSDDVNPARPLLAGIDVSREPHYSVSEIAKFFFGITGHRMRWLERRGGFVMSGKSVGTTRTPQGARVYTLADVEQIARALASNGMIEQEELITALRLVKHEAQLWKYLPFDQPKRRRASANGKR